MGELEGCRALVTGAGRGLGRAIAELFIERGAKVVCSDVDEPLVSDTVKEIGAARAVHCDVTDEAGVAACMATTAEELGGLDILVNNAGIEIVKPLFEQTDEEFRRLMDINVRGVWLGMKHALPHLAASAGAGADANVINMSSVAGIGGAPLFGSYCASKAAVVNMTRVAAVELRAVGIRVNAVCPAFIDTKMVERLVPAVEAVVGMPFGDIAAIKQGRLGTAEEVAETVAFLASRDASWTTGSAYVLDNGLTASLL
ncbi:MAG TPA: SDR family oxidoreductase [Solirubrobacteraceae bacterium]|nr:SDR family oxidoreductase [Solirubrobacteraceae bacterium]